MSNDGMRPVIQPRVPLLAPAVDTFHPGVRAAGVDIERSDVDYDVGAARYVVPPDMTTSIAWVM